MCLVIPIEGFGHEANNYRLFKKDNQNEIIVRFSTSTQQLIRVELKNAMGNKRQSETYSNPGKEITVFIKEELAKEDVIFISLINQGE
ncbi:MAG: hypothetical protein JKY53_01080 [Flavobacteriales bacterium]|nr:hypothetical protein [Flavobacteriales bacterium]